MARTLAFSIGIEDCRVETFCAGGKGGQHQNATQTGVRVIHPPSGAVGEARDSRSQPQNKVAAFSRMARSAAFQQWARAHVFGHRERAAAAVEAAMDPRHLREEVYDVEARRWVPLR